jgi:FkbM family methyltransferase
VAELFTATRCYVTPYTAFYRKIHDEEDLLPAHRDYMLAMRDVLGIQPRVIYDIGSAVLHWTKRAKQVWPDAQIIAFDALEELAEFYTQFPEIPSHIALLSDEPGQTRTYYAQPYNVGGNSYYRENSQYSPAAATLYDDSSARQCVTDTVDNIAAVHGLPMPDFIKLDVQGAELDILRGMPNVLKHVQHMIIELQHVEYNIGAKQSQESILVLESLGFTRQHPPAVLSACADAYFCNNGYDADYHFFRAT